MRHLLIALPLLLGSATLVHAQISVGIHMPGAQIGFNTPVYPQLVRVPGYPVYYAPQARSNYFFYEGLYWVFHEDRWYESSWYNGPWQQVEPDFVPLFVLRIPVRYYRQPPAYFRGWRADAAPRWGEHWGREWEERRSGWDQWNRRSVPRAAPLPGYQRQFSGARYPQTAQQQGSIRAGSYRYQPRDDITRQHIEQRRDERPRPERADPRMASPGLQRQEQSPAPPAQPYRGADRSAAPVQRPTAPVAEPPAQQRPQRPPAQARDERGRDDASRTAPRAQRDDSANRPQRPQREDDARRGPRSDRDDDNKGRGRDRD